MRQSLGYGAACACKMEQEDHGEDSGEPHRILGKIYSKSFMSAAEREGDHTE